MSKIILSEEACKKAISYSEEASIALLQELRIMDNDVNSCFQGLQDPTIQKYLQLSSQMQDMIKQVTVKMNEISEYCQGVIRWIEIYKRT